MKVRLPSLWAERYVEARDRLLADAATMRRGSRRSAIPIMAAGLALIGGMYQLVSANVLAVNFATTSSNFTVYSNYLEAREAAGFMGPGTKASDNEAVADLGIETLNLVGLCIIAQQSTPLPMSLLVTAGMNIPDPVANWDSGDVNGSDNDPFDTDALLPSVGAKVNAAGQVQNVGTDPDVVHAEFGYLNTTLLSAFGNQVAGMYLGETADTVAEHAQIGAWPVGSGGATPTAGDLGIYAKQLNLSGVGGASFGLNLKGSISLPKLSIRVLPGKRTQADCS